MRDRPDLVLFLTDQQRHDQTGWASAGHFETPNLDRLASAGTTFLNAYSAATTCVPARVALLTGLEPSRLPTQGNQFALREGFWTLARALRDSGYETAAIGKMHFAPLHADHGFETLRLCEHMFIRGYESPADTESPEHFDHYHHWLEAEGYGEWRNDAAARLKFPHSEDVHPTGWVEREARKFLAERDSSRPLFLVVSFPHPHAPNNPPEPYRSKYRASDSQLPESTFKDNNGLPVVFKRAMKNHMGRPTPRVDPKTNKPLPALIAKTRALINQIDGSIGRVADDLDLNDTVVFFTSDHGDYSGHRGLLRKNPWIPFDDLAKVPFFMTGGDVAAGVSTSLVQSSDLTLTCLDYAGLARPDLPFETKSLRPLAANGVEDPDRAVFSSMAMGWPMVREGDFKLITHISWRVGALFDLASDPRETVNLRKRRGYTEIGDRLAAMINERIERPTLETSA